MRVLVTGGAGFIGGNVCRALVQQPWVEEVRVIDNLSNGHIDALRGTDVQFSEASILDIDALAASARGVDAIVHLAALGSVPRSIADPVASHHANASGTLNVLQAARENDNAHVVLASSSSVYGANPVLPKVEDLRTIPMSPYAVSKLAGEQYAMAFATCYDLPVLPFRFFNVFGPGQRPGHIYSAVIPVFVEAALRGEVVPVNGDGEQSRDFTYVGTVVRTITAALEGRVTAEPTNLAFGTRTTLNELIELLREQLGVPLTVEHREPRPADVRHSKADNSRLRSLFPDLTPTELGTGLAETIEWMSGYLSAPYGSSTPAGV